MPYAVTLPAFSGPLDLLLRLIEREELDITQIALAQVADQYLVYVRSLAAPEPQALAEFVSLAARLLLIKSRALLPRATSDGQPVVAPDPDAEALAHQLREYRRYKAVAALFKTWQDEERRTFLRLALTPIELDLPLPPVTHTVDELLAAFQRRLQMALPLEPSAPITLRPRLTVTQVVTRLRERLAHQAWLSFEDLLGLTVTHEDVLVTFWAILEWLKRQAIVVEQTALFGTISIGRGSTALATVEVGENAL